MLTAGARLHLLPVMVGGALPTFTPFVRSCWSVAVVWMCCDSTQQAFAFITDKAALRRTSLFAALFVTRRLR